MSDYEHKIGKLVNTYLTVEEWMNELLGDTIHDTPVYYGSLREWFKGDFYDDCVEFEGTVWKIVTEDKDPYEDISLVNRIGNDITFEFRYYNGGTNYSELLNEALKKL